MALSTQPYKGARDFYPEDMRLQKWMFGALREVVESFGYEEYNTPLLEPLELYLAKTGEEIVNEQTYAFEDRGGRKVAIRPEMTPSVSRLVAARRQEAAYPLRWFNIGNRWRYERPQRGRVREFFQLDVDIFGVAGIEAEHEIISVADATLQAFGAQRTTYTINLNSRKLMNYIFEDYLGLDERQAHDLAKLIDRKNKMEADAFAASAQEIIGSPETTAKLARLLATKELDDLPDEVKQQPSVAEITKLHELLQNSGVTNSAFDITLMRGFDYYTDIVFEVFDNHPENNRSMFGGGRYDGLVGLFGVEPVPTVGFAMGDLTLQNFLETHKLLPTLKPEVDLYVVLVGDVYVGAQKILANLRENGIKVAVDSTGRKPDKQTKTADKKGIEQVLFIGEQELADGTFSLKNMGSGESQSLTIQQLIDKLKK